MFWFYTIFIVANERTDVVQRSQSLNHHQNSFVQESFSWFHVTAAQA